MAEQKKAPSTNGEFKTSPLGFDKAEVMAYIVQHNKERKALKEENDELKRALEEKQQTNEGQSNELTAELEKKKAELDAQILESRKQVLDERRKLAQTEKELHVMQDKYSALTEEFTEFKRQAAAKIDKAKHSGGTIDPAQLAEISAKANADANAVIDDAQSKANEIITAAKAYFADTVKKTYDYKQSVLEKAGTFANGVTSGAAAPAIDIQAVLANITASVNEAVEKALAGANAVNDAVAKAVEDTKAVNDVLAKAVEEAAQAETATDNTADVPEEKLSDDEELINAKSELENIGGLDESELDAYAPMEIEPYNFELKLDMPAQTNDDDDDDDDDMLTDNNGLLSSFEIVSGDDDISADNVDTGDLLVEETPAADDMADLLVEEPAAASAPKADTAPVADDFSDLLADEPAPAPVAKAEPAPAADDFSDLLADEPAPAAKTERTADRSGDKPKEKLNESRSMGVAGKEEKVNDPWKDLEAQMNGMSITPPPAHKQADDDGMTSSFDDPAAPAASAKEEKIDMSDYSSMLGGINDNMTTNTAQYDPSWDLKMMEGLKDNDDDDDEMSSDNVGFFDL